MSRLSQSRQAKQERLEQFLRYLRRLRLSRPECLKRANAARVTDADEYALMVVEWLTRKAGFSLDELADVSPYRVARLLTDAGVPTAWGVREWHPTQARRLLERAGLRTPKWELFPQQPRRALDPATRSSP